MITRWITIAYQTEPKTDKPFLVIETATTIQNGALGPKMYQDIKVLERFATQQEGYDWLGEKMS